MVVQQKGNKNGRDRPFRPSSQFVLVCQVQFILTDGDELQLQISRFLRVHFPHKFVMEVEHAKLYVAAKLQCSVYAFSTRSIHLIFDTRSGKKVDIAVLNPE